MTDDLQQSPPESQSKNLPIENEAIPPQLKKSNKNLWVILGVLASVLCICSIICIALVSFSAGKVTVEKAPVEFVLDAFIKHMVAKDVKAAYALFSPRAQRQVPISKIQEMIEGNNYVLVEGYKNLSVTNLNLTAAVNANQDIPQGTVANVTGTIDYENDIQGTFTATLEKVDGKWMIDAIFISVPPNKFKS